MKVVAIYAGLLAVLFFVLSVRTLRLRRSLKIGIGDGGSDLMLRAMRVHANFAEYVPFCLLLLVLVEMRGTSPLYVHALSACLLLGRLSHAYGVSQARENYVFRVAGMALTFACLLSSAGILLLGQVQASQ